LGYSMERREGRPQKMTSPLQIYSGYTEEDVLLLQSFVVQKASLERDFYIDGFSNKTLFSSVPFREDFDLERLTLPAPDDGFHAEALEYVTVCDSVKRAGSSYCIVEVGAGWGPWINLGGVLARSHGIKDINIIGVEAHPGRFDLMKKQLSANLLRPVDIQNTTDFNGVKCKLIQGAASAEHKTLWFPNFDIKDMGAAASDANVSNDYRGLNADNFPVAGFVLKEIIDDLIIDLLHIDIQGAEFDIINSGIDCLNTQVKSMMIATHSRVIEGKLIELLYENGWYLHREKPCRVEWREFPASLEAMTQVDGSQYWRRSN